MLHAFKLNNTLLKERWMDKENIPRKGDCVVFDNVRYIITDVIWDFDAPSINFILKENKQ